MTERSGWTGDWLSGPGAVGEPAGPEQPQQWRGQRLGFPRGGPGAVAGFGQRVAAIFVDWVPCAILAQLLTTNPSWSALMFFAVLTVVGVGGFGRTPGHAALGLRVVMLDGGGRPQLVPVFVRTALLCLAIPPLVYNADGRGLHDRAARTIVLRTR